MLLWRLQSVVNLNNVHKLEVYITPKPYRELGLNGETCFFFHPTEWEVYDPLRQIRRILKMIASGKKVVVATFDYQLLNALDTTIKLWVANQNPKADHKMVRKYCKGYFINIEQLISPADVRIVDPKAGVLQYDNGYEFETLKDRIKRVNNYGLDIHWDIYCYLTGEIK